MKLNYNFGTVSQSDFPVEHKREYCTIAQLGAKLLKHSGYMLLFLLFFVSFDTFSKGLSTGNDYKDYKYSASSSIVTNNLSTFQVPIVTTIKSNQCGTTLSQIYSSILAETVAANVTLYTFEVTDPNSVVQTISTSDFYFQLTDLADYQYNTTYSVRVGLHVDGVFQGFGRSCNVSTPTLNLVIPQCATTLVHSYSPIFITGANFISSFEVKATNSNGTQTVTITQPFFQLSIFSQIYESSSAIGMAYSIQVRAKTTGDYGDWSPACTIMTPDTGISVPINSNQCNNTLPRIYSSIFATVGIPNVTMFAFEVKDPNNFVQTHYTTNHWFQLTDLASYDYNTTYAIRIGMFINGIFQGYGRPCEISTPPENIIIPQCDTTLTNAYSPIFITGPNFISSYEIRVTNDLGTQTITRTQPFFSIKMFPSIYNSSAMRSNYVEVRVKTTGNYGPWTTACEIITPAFPAAAAARDNFEQSKTFAETNTIIAYPNPFNETFSLQSTEVMEGIVDVHVYDMLGKLLETRSLDSSNLSSLQLGSKLPTGVYNVIVISENSSKSYRVIKR